MSSPARGRARRPPLETEHRRPVIRTRTSVLLAALALAAPAGAAAADAEHLAGKFTHGQQVSLFEPCGAEEALWLLLEGDSARHLVEASRELTTDAYEGVYAEIVAVRRENRGVPDVPEEYDALLAVEKVYEVRPLPQRGCD